MERTNSIKNYTLAALFHPITWIIIIIHDYYGVAALFCFLFGYNWQTGKPLWGVLNSPIRYLCRQQQNDHLKYQGNHWLINRMVGQFEIKCVFSFCPNKCCSVIRISVSKNTIISKRLDYPWQIRQTPGWICIRPVGHTLKMVGFTGIITLS